jgi:hypothetical protein
MKLKYVILISLLIVAFSESYDCHAKDAIDRYPFIHQDTVSDLKKFTENLKLPGDDAKRSGVLYLTRKALWAYLDNDVQPQNIPFDSYHTTTHDDLTIFAVQSALKPDEVHRYYIRFTVTSKVDCDVSLENNAEENTIKANTEDQLLLMKDKQSAGYVSPDVMFLFHNNGIKTKIHMVQLVKNGVVLNGDPSLKYQTDVTIFKEAMLKKRCQQGLIYLPTPGSDKGSIIYNEDGNRLVAQNDRVVLIDVEMTHLVTDLNYNKKLFIRGIRSGTTKLFAIESSITCPERLESLQKYVPNCKDSAYPVLDVQTKQSVDLVFSDGKLNGKVIENFSFYSKDSMPSLKVCLENSQCNTYTFPQFKTGHENCRSSLEKELQKYAKCDPNNMRIFITQGDINIGYVHWTHEGFFGELKIHLFKDNQHIYYTVGDVGMLKGYNLTMNNEFTIQLPTNLAVNLGDTGYYSKANGHGKIILPVRDLTGGCNEMMMTLFKSKNSSCEGNYSSYNTGGRFERVTLREFGFELGNGKTLPYANSTYMNTITDGLVIRTTGGILFFKLTRECLATMNEMFKKVKSTKESIFGPSKNKLK